LEGPVQGGRAPLPRAWRRAAVVPADEPGACGVQRLAWRVARRLRCGAALGAQAERRRSAACARRRAQPTRCDSRPLARRAPRPAWRTRRLQRRTPVGRASRRDTTGTRARRKEAWELLTQRAGRRIMGYTGGVAVQPTHGGSRT